MVRNLFIFSIAVLAYLVVRGWEQEPITHPPGILADGIPLQVDPGTGSVHRAVLPEQGSGSFAD